MRRVFLLQIRGLFEAPWCRLTVNPLDNSINGLLPLGSENSWLGASPFVCYNTTLSKHLVSGWYTLWSEIIILHSRVNVWLSCKNPSVISWLRIQSDLQIIQTLCSTTTFTANPRPHGHFTNETNLVFLSSYPLFNAVCPFKFDKSHSRWLCLTKGSSPNDVITSLRLLLPPLLLLTVLLSEDLSQQCSCWTPRPSRKWWITWPM